MDIKIAFDLVYKMLNMRFTLLFMDLTLWQIALFLMIAAALIFLIGGLLR